jgi:hypothetical protein
MEAQGRRFSGGFPGYDGPALPRAMRSSRVLILLMSFLTSSFLSACFVLPVSYTVAYNALSFCGHSLIESICSCSSYSYISFVSNYCSG